MNLFEWYLFIGAVHVTLQYTIRWRLLARNRTKAASTWYVGFGYRPSETSMVIFQIAVGFLLWPLGVLALLLPGVYANLRRVRK